MNITLFEKNLVLFKVKINNNSNYIDCYHHHYYYYYYLVLVLVSSLLLNCVYRIKDFFLKMKRNIFKYFLEE